MNFGQIRKVFIERSGRYDLITGKNEDDGANFFITSGQRFLELISSLDKSTRRAFKLVGVNDYYVTIPYARSIDEVWLSSLTERKELIFKTIKELRTKYTEPFGTLDTDEPTYYGIASLGSVEQDSGLSGYSGFIDAVVSDSDDLNGVIFYPPADGAYMIEVIGKFFLDELADDNDVNVWTTKYPNLLVMSAMRQLEVFHRNSAGVKDWTSAIGAELMEIDKDAIEKSDGYINQMEG